MSILAWNIHDRGQHRRIILLCSILSRLTVASVVFLSTLVPPFDSSHTLITGDALVSRWSVSTLRWDAFHLVHIAQGGYTFEYEYAFFPGVPLVMRAMVEIGRVVGLVSWSEQPSVEQLLCSGALGALLFDSSLVFYELTLQVTKSAEFAVLCSLLLLLPTSPATFLFGTYSEPFFAYFTFRGMLFAERQQFSLAAIFFALATAFRANGVLLGGYIVWGLIVLPLLRRQKVTVGTVARMLFLVVISTSTFFIHQLQAYQYFCQGSLIEPSPEWCSYRVPLIYPAVQAKYWNVGFLKYWKIAQLPNFILGGPVLALLGWASVYRVKAGMLHATGRNGLARRSPLDMYGIHILPYALHGLVMSLILLLASHTQIVLRLASSLPMVYWAVGDLLVWNKSLARSYVMWNVVWYAVSCVLWGAFLPPA